MDPGARAESAAACRMRVVPRKVRPFVPRRKVVLIPGPVARPSEERAATMSITDPLSLTEAKRLAGSADTVLLRATRDADLETPIGAFLRLDAGAPAYLLESGEGGERLSRYSFLGTGTRWLLEARGHRAMYQRRPLRVVRFDSALPIETLE